MWCQQGQAAFVGAEPGDERILPDANEYVAVEQEADAAEHLLQHDRPSHDHHGQPRQCHEQLPPLHAVSDHGNQRCQKRSASAGTLRSGLGGRARLSQ
jgi:hypothetical protein